METVYGPIADLLVMILMYLLSVFFGFSIFLAQVGADPEASQGGLKTHQELSGNHNKWINL